MDQQHRNDMIHTLDKLFEASAFDGRDVYLFGHCNATEEMAGYLLSRGLTPAAILDNSTSKQGQAYLGIPIVSPGGIMKPGADEGMVLIATRFFAEMAEQLGRIGYKGKIIQVVEYNSFADFSLSDEAIYKKYERMLRGKKRLASIRLDYPTQLLVICPNNALGDVYWAMAFLPGYCEKHRIESVAVALIGEACRQTAELFGIDDVIVLTEAQMDELVQAVIFTHEGNCIIAHHDRPYTDNIVKYLDKHFLSFIDYYRCGVYGLGKDVPPAHPSQIEPYIDTHQMKEGKSAILSPYAKSVVELPAGFWAELASDYARQGYMVFTNTAGDEEPIAGTEPFKAPVSQLIRAAGHAGTFIGIRSGLCDILHTAACRKIVVFPDCYYSTTPHKVADFFALPGWESIIVKGNGG